MRKFTVFLMCSLFLVGTIIAGPGSAHALLLTGQDIIAAPASTADDSPGAENAHQQGFDEMQNVYLTSDLAVDGGNISADTWVSSHMIFFNTADDSIVSDVGIKWTFDGIVLGVMSDRPGALETASNSLLGAPGTFYPGSFTARGMESSGIWADSYSVLADSITVNMHVSEPGDWIRVVTKAPQVPEPATMLLLGMGLFGLAGFSRKKLKT